MDKANVFKSFFDGYELTKLQIGPILKLVEF